MYSSMLFSSSFCAINAIFFAMDISHLTNFTYLETSLRIVDCFTHLEKSDLV